MANLSLMLITLHGHLDKLQSCICFSSKGNNLVTGLTQRHTIIKNSKWFTRDNLDLPVQIACFYRVQAGWMKCIFIIRKMSLFRYITANKVHLFCTLLFNNIVPIDFFSKSFTKQTQLTKLAHIWILKSQNHLLLFFKPAVSPLWFIVTRTD